jgi:hypothetical protein
MRHGTRAPKALDLKDLEPEARAPKALDLEPEALCPSLLNDVTCFYINFTQILR